MTFVLNVNVGDNCPKVNVWFTPTNTQTFASLTNGGSHYNSLLLAATLSKLISSNGLRGNLRDREERHGLAVVAAGGVERVLVAQDAEGGHGVERAEDGEDGERHRGERRHGVRARLVGKSRGGTEELLESDDPALIVTNTVENILEIVNWVAKIDVSLVIVCVVGEEQFVFLVRNVVVKPLKRGLAGRWLGLDALPLVGPQ